MAVNMVRVLQYIGSLQFGGSQMFVMELYRKIDRSRLQFDFVTFPNEKGELYSEIICMGGRIFECPRYNGKNHFQFCKWWDTFLTMHPEYRVVHGHVRSTASLYLAIAKRHGCVTIAHSHSTSNGRGVSAVVKDLMQLPVRKRADYLFSCSDQAGIWLFGKAAVKLKNYYMIPNAISCERFVYDRKKREEFRKKLNIEECFVVGNVGRFTKPKNHTFLLDVFADLHKNDKKTRLLLVGDGDLREALEKKCNQLGVRDAVIFAGNQINTQNYYWAMDVLVFPSLWEGLGITVIEAQAAGLPCVVSSAVPGEVDVKTGLVTVLALNDRISKWTEEILKEKGRRRLDQTGAIRAAGFDAADNARDLQKFYIKESGR